ncbi:MAG: hypothetical protein AAGL96_12910, partial [Pseudomonadota bacterium]
MFEAQQFTRNVGIRQRSLRKHCRFGRATELVYVLATGVVLTVAGTDVDAQQTWLDTNADNDWNTVDPNWDGGVVYNEPEDAIFAGTGEVVNIDEAGGIDANSVTFDVDGYEITGNDLNVTGNITVTNGADSATISANISNDASANGAGSLALSGTVGGNLSNTGTGTVTITNTVTGDLDSDAGTTIVDTNGVITGTTTIDNSTVVVDNTGAGTGGVLTGTVTVNSGGTLDVNDGTVGNVDATGTGVADISGG